jgi:hypothetical protein
MEPGGECARGATHVLIAVRAAPEPVVVDEEIAAARGEIVEEIDERVARHG